MSAVTFTLAAAFIVAVTIATLALLDRVNLRAELAESRCETADARAVAARLEDSLHLSQVGSLSAAERMDEVNRTAHRAFAEADKWRRKYEDATDEAAWMRMRGRILPDIDDRAERMVFDDGGESPIFDAMPVGLLAEYVAVAG